MASTTPIDRLQCNDKGCDLRLAKNIVHRQREQLEDRDKTIKELEDSNMLRLTNLEHRNKHIRVQRAVCEESKMRLEATIKELEFKAATNESDMSCNVNDRLHYKRECEKTQELLEEEQESATKHRNMLELYDVDQATIKRVEDRIDELEKKLKEADDRNFNDIRFYTRILKEKHGIIDKKEATIKRLKAPKPASPSLRAALRNHLVKAMTFKLF